MVRKLGRARARRRTPLQGRRADRRGRRLALEVLRHHRLLETFLATSLGVPWDRVHDEAEVLEHVLSEELEALIADKLGHPTHDPHGDPIPSADLELIEEPRRRASPRSTPAPAAARPRIGRARDAPLPGRARDRPGDAFEVIERQPFDGPLFVRFGEGRPVLGGSLARAMRVEVRP